MSANLMETTPGGEQNAYEDQGAPEGKEHKKSTGQLGDISNTTTTDPSNTSADAQRQAQRGAQTAENIRYGQTISEGGMGGMTSVQDGKATNEGYGRLQDRAEGGDAGKERVQAGYGGEKDMDRNVGA